MSLNSAVYQLPISVLISSSSPLMCSCRCTNPSDLWLFPSSLSFLSMLFDSLFLFAKLSVFLLWYHKALFHGMYNSYSDSKKACVRHIPEPVPRCVIGKSHIHTAYCILSHLLTSSEGTIRAAATIEDTEVMRLYSKINK